MSNTQFWLITQWPPRRRRRSTAVNVERSRRAGERIDRLVGDDGVARALLHVGLNQSLDSCLALFGIKGHYRLPNRQDGVRCCLFAFRNIELFQSQFERCHTGKPYQSFDGHVSFIGTSGYLKGLGRHRHSFTFRQIKLTENTNVS